MRVRKRSVRISVHEQKTAQPEVLGAIQLDVERAVGRAAARQPAAAERDHQHARRHELSGQSTALEQSGNDKGMTICICHVSLFPWLRLAVPLIFENNFVAA